MCVFNRVYMHRETSRSAPLSVFSFLPFFSGFLSFAGFFASLLSRSPFSHLLPSRVLPPSIHPPAAEGQLVFFLPQELESLSLIPQRQIVCNAYLNTDTRYTLRSVLHTVAGLKDAGEARRGVTTSLYLLLTVTTLALQSSNERSLVTRLPFS